MKISEYPHPPPSGMGLSSTWRTFNTPRLVESISRCISSSEFDMISMLTPASMRDKFLIRLHQATRQHKNYLSTAHAYVLYCGTVTICFSTIRLLLRSLDCHTNLSALLQVTTLDTVITLRKRAKWLQSPGFVWTKVSWSILLFILKDNFLMLETPQQYH